MLGLPFYIKLNYCKYHTEKDIIPSFFVYLRLKSYNSCTIKMAKNPLYSLSIDEIESNAKDFVDNLGDKYSFTFEEKKVNEKRITISEGGNSGILICYIIKGQVSFQVQGKQKMSSLCEECKEHIIKTTKLVELSCNICLFQELLRKLQKYPVTDDKNGSQLLDGRRIRSSITKQKNNGKSSYQLVRRL